MIRSRSNLNCRLPSSDANSSSKSLNCVGDDERISLNSFERRRSVYECVITDKKDADEADDSHTMDADPSDEHPNQHLRIETETKLASMTADKMSVSAWSQSNGLETKLMPLHQVSRSNSLGDENLMDIGTETHQPNRQSGSQSIDLDHETRTGFEVVWLNFTYSINPNFFENPRWGRINKLFHKEPRQILKGISGGFISGQMIALMGPSGAGKTCLLECISGVRSQGIGGRLCMRGRKNAQLVIVPQYDSFMPQFSVEELITYGSKMKNPIKADHAAIVDKVITQLGLQVCRRNNIKKCSGGQQKRVAIAQELVSRPNILILDEPTSGLDSSCCYQTVKVLREVLDESVRTKEPMAIVATIHQPSAKVFKMFDQVYILSKKGSYAYSGPPGGVMDTIRIVTGLKCPQYSNPSDFILEIVSYDYGEGPADRLIEFEREKCRNFERGFEARSSAINQDIAHTSFSSSGMDITNQIDVSASDTNGCLRQSNIEASNNFSPISTDQFPSILSPAMKLSKSDSNLTGSIRGGNVRQEKQTSFIRQAIELSTKSKEFKQRPYVTYKNNSISNLRRATNNKKTGRRFFWHLYLHCERSFKQAVRDPILSRMRILIHLIFSIMVVVLYGKKGGQARGCPPILGLPIEITDPDGEVLIDLADNLGFLFMSMMQITYVALMSMTLTVPVDIKTVGREYRNGWFGTVTYSLGKTFADLPFIILYTSAYCTILWYFTSQATDSIWRFLSYTSLIIINALNAQSYGLILGALFVNSVTSATFLGPVTTLPWYLFTGYTKRLQRMGPHLRSASKLMYTRHIFEGIMTTVYGFERCNCSAFLEQYYKLRQEETARLGQLVSAESLLALDYYDGIDTIAIGKTGNETLHDKPPEVISAQADLTDLSSFMDSNEKASSLFSFGLDFEPTCPSDYRNYVMQDFELDDKALENSFTSVIIILLIIRLLTIVIVTWKIRTREL